MPNIGELHIGEGGQLRKQVVELEDEADLVTPIATQVVQVGQVMAGHRTEPEVGESMPARRWSRVDLPQPDGPVMATDSPNATVRSIPARALTWPG